MNAAVTNGSAPLREAPLRLTDASDLWGCLKLLAPREPSRHLDWAIAHIKNETGRAYDHERYPHQGNPGGPLDALDSERTREVVLQWGVRLGKTFSGQVALLKSAEDRPGPMMWATAQQKLAKENMEKLFDLLEQSRLHRLLGKPRHLQRRDMVTFRANKLYLAWSRSPATLADKNIRYGHAGEIDKWEHASTSTEGDPLDLFLDRFNDYLPVRRIVLESTPSVKTHSRVERWRLTGSNCRYEVPCPWCRGYQELEWGTEAGTHGIQWDRGADGKSDVETASRTARYVCRHCHKGIDSASRRWMMGRGVWVPDGYETNDAEALRVTASLDRPRFAGWETAVWCRRREGTPPANNETYSSRLPAWYSLAIPSWGYFAGRFVRIRGRKAALQVFVNQIKAETWESLARTGTWQEVGERIIDLTLPRGLVPDGCRVLACGIDKQGDEYKWVVDAFLPGNRVHCVDYGQIDDDHHAEARIQDLLTRSWAAQCGPSRAIQMTLVDCGFRSGEVYGIVGRLRRRGIRIFPSKGASKPLDTYAALKVLSKKSTHPGMKIVWIDAASTQDLIDRQLHEGRPGQPNHRSVFCGSLEEHQDYLEEMLNDGPDVGLDSSNNLRETWKRRDESIPNDWRDASRYAFCAHLRIGRRDWLEDERRQRLDRLQQEREREQEAKREQGVPRQERRFSFERGRRRS